MPWTTVHGSWSGTLSSLYVLFASLTPAFAPGYFFVRVRLSFFCGGVFGMAERRGFGDFGYRKSTGEYVSALEDMLDGGGAGRSGEEFEGGGILSLLANLLFSPRGSRGEPMRPRSRPSGGSSPTSGGRALAVGSSLRPRSRPLPAEDLVGPPGGVQQPADYVRVTDSFPARTMFPGSLPEDVARSGRVTDSFPGRPEVLTRTGRPMSALPVDYASEQILESRTPSKPGDAGFGSVVVPSEVSAGDQDMMSGLGYPSELLMEATPEMPSSPPMPAAQPGADARALRNILAGEAQALDSALDSAPRLPSEEMAPVQRGSGPGEAETALNLIRNNRVRRESSAFPELVALINSRGTAAQRAELAQYLP